MGNQCKSSTIDDKVFQCYNFCGNEKEKDGEKSIYDSKIYKIDEIQFEGKQYKEDEEFKEKVSSHLPMNIDVMNLDDSKVRRLKLKKSSEVENAIEILKLKSERLEKEKTTSTTPRNNSFNLNLNSSSFNFKKKNIKDSTESSLRGSFCIMKSTKSPSLGIEEKEGKRKQNQFVISPTSKKTKIGFEIHFTTTPSYTNLIKNYSFFSKDNEIYISLQKKLDYPSLYYNIELIKIINQLRENPKSLSVYFMKSISYLRRVMMKEKNKEEEYTKLNILHFKKKGYYLLNDLFTMTYNDSNFQKEKINFFCFLLNSFLNTESLKYDDGLCYILPNDYDLISKGKYFDGIKSNFLSKNSLNEYSVLYFENIIEPEFLVSSFLMDKFFLVDSSLKNENALSEISIFQKCSLLLNPKFKKIGVVNKSYSTSESNIFSTVIILST